METVSTNFKADYNGTYQNDPQYLHWRKCCQNDNRYLQWRKFRQNDKTFVSWIQMLTSLHFIIYRWPQQTHRILIGSSRPEYRIRPFRFHVASLAEKENISPRDLKRKFNWFLPKASFVLWVLSLPTSVFVCACFRQPRACPCAHSSSVPARTT